MTDTYVAVFGIFFCVIGLAMICGALIDLWRIYQRKRDLERYPILRLPPPAPPVPLPRGWIRCDDMMLFRVHNDGREDRYIVPPVWPLPPMRELQPPPISPQTQSLINEMVRQRAEVMERALRFGSQAFVASDRCDICGARIIQRHHDKTILFYQPYKDSKRCQGLCGWNKSETQKHADRLESRDEGQLPVPARLPPPRNAV